MDDFDYSLVIEFERQSNRELDEILKVLYTAGSSECFVDIEYLADEVIRRLNECQYDIKEKRYTSLKNLIFYTFETLKKIAPFMERPSSRIYIIHDLYQKYTNIVDSPVASPVVSPIKMPKIMKKVNKKK